MKPIDLTAVTEKKIFHYVTIKADTFMEIARHELTVPKDSFLTADNEVAACKDLFRKGYRFVCIHEGYALFEKKVCR